MKHIEHLRDKIVYYDWEKIDPRRINWRNYFRNGVNGLCALRKKDGGMALITVVVVIAIMTLIITTLADVSVFSFQRKTVDYASKNNFYDAEGAMDDIQIGLQSIVAPNLQYIQDPTTYTNSVLAELASQSGGNIADLFESYVSSDYKGAGTNLDVTVGMTYVDGRSVVIKDVTVAYTDADGYYSCIKTDIRLAAPEITLDDPLGSYSTIAGSGMFFLGQNNGETKANSGYVNFTGSIYIGYQEDIQDVAAAYPDFNTQWQHWNSITIEARRAITYSGDSVTVNGNIFLSPGATLRLEGDKAKIYGGIILSEGATLVLDEDTDLTCYGIYTYDSNTGALTEYAGNLEGTLDTIRDANGYYTGHIPYTYPYIVDLNWAQIVSSGGADNIYPGLDSFEYYTNIVPTNNWDKQALCFANIYPGTTYNNLTPVNMQGDYCSMNYSLPEATILLGTECDEENEFVRYAFADDFVYTQNGTTHTYQYDNMDAGGVGGVYDYSGIAYPITLESDGTAKVHMYGKVATGMTESDEKSSVLTKVVDNITIDKTYMPMPKVQSKYIVDYDTLTAEAQSAVDSANIGTTNYDAVVYDFLELEYALALDGGTMQYANGVVDGTPIESMLGTNVQPVNGNSQIYFLVSYNSATVENAGYFRSLCFTAGLITVKTQSNAVIFQPIVTKSQQNKIRDFMSTGNNAEGEQIKAEYDAWGTTQIYTTGNETYLNKFITSDYRKDKLGLVDYAVKFPWRSAWNESYLTEEERVTINDWFKGGVQSLYMSQEDMINSSNNQNYSSFSVVSLENWSRQ